jgi:hypothetical protein
MGAEVNMIEMTENLRIGVQTQLEGPVRLVDSSTRREFVLVPAEEYDRLVEDYDDSPWTDEEMALLAAENAELLGWQGMEDYQDMEP